MNTLFKIAAKPDVQAGTQATAMLESQGGQKNLMEGAKKTLTEEGLTGLLKKGSEVASEVQKETGKNGTVSEPPSVPAQLQKAKNATGETHLPEGLTESLIKQAQSAAPSTQAAAGQAPGATISMPFSTQPTIAAPAPTEEGVRLRREAEKLRGEQRKAEAEKATADAERAKAESDKARAIESKKKAEANAAEKDAKIKEQDEIIKKEQAKTAQVLAELEEANKKPLPADGIKRKINDEFFNNLHLFFGEKHLETLSETIDPYLKLEELRDISIGNKNKRYEVLIGLVRNMIYNFSRGKTITAVMSGGGSLDQLKKIIKKRVSDIKPKFIT